MAEDEVPRDPLLPWVPRGPPLPCGTTRSSTAVRSCTAVRYASIDISRTSLYQADVYPKFSVDSLPSSAAAVPSHP